MLADEDDLAVLGHRDDVAPVGRVEREDGAALPLVARHLVVANAEHVELRDDRAFVPLPPRHDFFMLTAAVS